MLNGDGNQKDTTTKQSSKVLTHKRNQRSSIYYLSESNDNPFMVNNDTSTHKKTLNSSESQIILSS